MRWTDIAAETPEELPTFAMEISGVGVIVQNSVGNMVFVPGTRIKNGELTREDRSNPPLRTGRSANEIRAAQPLIPDTGALTYVRTDDETY